ncbi:C4-dicarboxylate TRAP transporter substrate-binding protein [Vandammella animalimorsus]|uniref:ABC transporter substrate-binding protein n=1 Tax=Vandammella animalimorsus TaxID=2029117 RepID=A0A2A2AUJ6_9BURK|nr:C4-dicarboxylate TRAP transporter substrate-binding protein [Vandammella animalimorsus]PAT42265.1 ABC transporter substrate-binding protein [Vandammella animalimorsus]
MQRRQFLRASSAAAATLGFPAVWGSARAAKTIQLKFDSYISESAGPSQLDEWFLKELEKRTNGEVKVRRYWAQSLNKVGEHLAAVRDRTSEMSLISPGYYQAQLPVTRGLEWYYRMNRADALQLVCRDLYQQFEPLRREWEERYRAKVMYWTNWYYAPLVTREPIRSIADIKGKRIRGYGVANDVIERLGGTAVPMAAPEVYTALERGVLDGVYGFDFITAVAYKLHEIAPHFTAIGDGPHGPSATIINKRVWDGFPEPVKAVCDQIVSEIYGGKYTEIFDKAARQYVATAKKEGAIFSTLPEAEQAMARQLIQPAQVNAWLERVAKPAKIDGSAMQQLIEAAIAKHDPAGRLLRFDELAAQG